MSRERVFRALLTVVFVGLLGFAAWKGHRAPPTVSHGPGFRFTEVSHSIGVDFVHRPAVLDAKLANIMPHVTGQSGAAVSVCDANGDGRPDLYATTNAPGAHNALFVNRGDGTFVDRAAEAGLAEVDVPGDGTSMGTIWADLDGDGDQDVYVYKWGRARLYRNDGGLRFTDVTKGSGLERRMNCNAAAFLDYDRDGRLDLYVAGYFRDDVDLWNLTTTRIMQESFEFAANGGHNYLYRNLGGLHFEDVTAATGVDSTRWALAVACADMNEDGFQDIYLANDYGPEELFLNVDGRRFELAREVGLDESSKSGMSVAMGDVMGDGHVGVFVTNISKSGYLFQGNNLRTNRLGARGRLENVAQDAVVDCGWAWGAQFGDFDNDGRSDLFVANGFVSASRERDYWFGMSKVAIGAGNLAEDAAFWPPMEDRSLSGYERSRVLWNQGRARFVDVAESVGVTDLLDGRAVALADLSGRGALDVVVSNQKGPLLVYRNEVAPGRHWVQYALVGKGENTSAVGGRVTVRTRDRVQAAVVQVGSGYCAQNDLVLHFGLGSAERIESVVIRWPSGVEQTLGGTGDATESLRLDRRHTIREPSP